MTSPYILIVDDDENVRHVLRRFVTPTGYEIVEAGTAEEAMCRVDEYPPAVAFCDVHMPGANGLWLADQIRSVSPSTAMVLATGDADVPASESFRPGIVAYLVKPLAQPDVLRAVADGIRWSTGVPGSPHATRSHRLRLLHEPHERIQIAATRPKDQPSRRFTSILLPLTDKGTCASEV